MSEDAQNLADVSGGVWSENPEWPVAEWQAEVAADATRRGYWDWVLSNISSGAEE
ncbi:MAG: hypothetical protein JWM36_2266 [Hyphomicrobiales bacterium]|nr:hypothetical protein [Hyphomicrobiales bacterium]